MPSEYAYSLLVSTDLEPLVVIASSSDGPWVAELSPSQVPDPPIEFFCVRGGAFGPLLNPAGLVLLRDDLLRILQELAAESFADYPATIRPPRSCQTIDRYSVVKVPRVTPLASIAIPAGRPTLSVVREAPDALLASHELCALLERRNVPGLAFSEPLFAGSTPAR